MMKARIVGKSIMSKKKRLHVDSFFLTPVTFLNLKLKIVSRVVCPFTEQIRLPWVTVYCMFVF